MGVSRDSWDTSYRDGEYLSNWDYAHPAQELVGALSVLNFPCGSAALDLGCGAGRDAIFLAQIGFRASGIDLSEEALRIASMRALQAGVEVEWRVGDVLALPFADASFDLITDRACFHHIPDGDRIAYAREVSRVLRPGGVLLIRGSRRRREDSFYEVTAESVRSCFSAEFFEIGPVLSIRLLNNAGGLDANMVMLRKL